MNILNSGYKNKIIFLRHGKIDLPYASHDVMPFAILNQLATQELDPSSDENYFISHKEVFLDLFRKFDFEHILYSPSRRCLSLVSYLQKLEKYSKIDTMLIPELQEIKFDLTKMFSTQEIDLPKLKAEITNQLINKGSGVESLSEVILRIKKLLNLLPSSGNILVLTHGYFMSVLVAYLECEGRITKEALESTPRFNYFGGFIFNENQELEYFSTI
jgi:broad specificity phosphatase PhoE